MVNADPDLSVRRAKLPIPESAPAADSGDGYTLLKTGKCQKCPPNSSCDNGKIVCDYMTGTYGATNGCKPCAKMGMVNPCVVCNKSPCDQCLPNQHPVNGACPQD